MNIFCFMIAIVIHFLTCEILTAVALTTINFFAGDLFAFNDFIKISCAVAVISFFIISVKGKFSHSEF